MQEKSVGVQTWLGLACGVGAGALWGMVFLAPQLAGAFGPLHLAVGRYAAYGVFSALLLAPRWRAIVGRLARREWVGLAWLAFAGNTLYYVLLSSAVQLAGIATTALVIGMLPVAVTIIGSRERGATPLRKLAPSLSLCAAAAACTGWQATRVPAIGTLGARIAGLLCAIGALASWTAFAVSNSRWLRRVEHVSVHDWNLLTGLMTGAQATLLLPLALIFEPQPHGRDAWALLVAVSVGVAALASIVGNALWNRMTRLLPLTLVGQMILFETLFALLYGFTWERRLPTSFELAAFVLVIASVSMCIAAHRSPASLEAPAGA